MASWKDKMDNIFMAITYAEANDHESARKLINAKSSTPLAKLSLLQKIEKIMTAITFAEGNCHDYAREVMNPGTAEKFVPSIEPEKKPSFNEVVGLAGIRIWYGTAEVA